VLVAYAAVCELYVSSAVNQTSELLNKAVENRQNGDYAASQEYADKAWETWRTLTARRGFVLADLSMISDVTVSLARVSVIAQSDDSDRFLEESIATLLMLEHLSDNQNIGSDVRH